MGLRRAPLLRLNSRSAIVLALAALILCLVRTPAEAALEDILYESGRITKEEWLKAKADREQEEAEREKRLKDAITNIDTRHTKKGSWVDSVVWSGDLRLRHGQFWRYGIGAVGNDRSRQRFRLRFGPKMKIQDFTLEVRLVSGSDSQVSTNQSFDEAFSSKPIQIDRVYVAWNPAFYKPMTLTGGKMKNPFKTNYTRDVLFDSDVTPEGFAEQFRWRINRVIRLFADFGQFVLDEDATDERDQWLFAYQGGVEAKLRNSKLRIAVGFYDAINLDAGGINEPTFQQFNSRTTAQDKTAAYVNDYNVLNLNGSFATEVAGLPVNIQGDWVYNTAGPVSCSGTGNSVGSCGSGNVRVEDQDKGYQVGIRLGKARKAKTWEVAYYYKWLQADAVLSAITDSDFGDGGTNRLGNIFWAAYNPTDFLTFKVKFYNTKPLVRSICGTDNSCLDDIDRLQVDMVWKF
ncbi:putative porin [Nitrospiraceae bacterium AH_259_D15_M11_P09]|nr:putative porin [Nitrospiraceae bacterium AH_259_D15_M11_P09]